MEKTYKSDVIWTLSFSIESQAMNRFMLLCYVICTHLLKDTWEKMLYSFKINHLYETPKCSQGLSLFLSRFCSLLTVEFYQLYPASSLCPSFYLCTEVKLVLIISVIFVDYILHLITPQKKLYVNTRQNKTERLSIMSDWVFSVKEKKRYVYHLVSAYSSFWS